MKLKRIKPEDIAEYGVVNAPDKLVGNPHDNKMIFDRLIREVVAGAINALIDQWEELDEAEDQRDEAEEQREAAEQARQEAENLRQNTFREEIEEAKGHEEGAYRAMNLAAENAHWSEAFAVGKENGVDIDSTNPAYRNNAKFYADQARNVVGGDDVFVCPNILVSAADWSASTKYDDFPWEATAQVKDINGQHVPFVVFDHVDAATYGLATVADTADESLTIYSVTMPERDILIPVTVFMSEGAIQSAWKALSGGKEGEVLAKQSGKDHDFKWLPISGLGAGLDGERGLAIYRTTRKWGEWVSDTYEFFELQLPAGYVPKVHDLVMTADNYLCTVAEVDETLETVVVISFDPVANLNGAPGPAGERGLAIYRCSQAMYGMTSDTIDFAKFQLPVGYVPKVNDLVITADNYLYYVYQVNATTGEIILASFYPAVNLNGATGPVGPTGETGPQGPAGPAGKDGSAGKDGAQGKDGERGLAIYRANKPWSDWSSEYFDFSDFQLPNGYVPKVNDLVLTANNYLCWIYEVNAVTDTFLVASFSPPANLNGSAGPAGADGKDGQDGEPGPAGADGKDGADGAPGKDGKDGADGKEGERGLAIYRCSQAMYGMTSDTIDFTKFQLPVGYVPKVNDLVITADNYLYYVYQVNATTDEITLASLYPPVNLNGAEGPVGADGEKGDPGERGTGILAVTTTPSAYTTEINGLTPAYRIALSTVTTQAKVSKVLVGDIVQKSYYHYPVIYVDGSYVYCGTRVSIRGATGAAGTPGEPGPAGDPGEKGEPGDTPYIGANGNWWIGGTDTGVAATGSGSGGASVQADWSENDETKLSHVKGRTHWKEQIGGDEIVPETTKTFDGYYVTVGGSKLGIVEGITYIVQFNGEEYTVVGQNYKGDMIMGNARLIDADGEDTEEPFVITWIGGTSYYLTRRKNNPRKLTVSVNSKKVVTWHKMDPGYLPDGVPYTEENVVEMLPETTVEIDPDTGEGYILDDVSVEVGNECIVAWNGVEYVCTAQSFDMDGLPCVVLGDIGVMTGGTSTGEPFVIVLFPSATAVEMGVGGACYALDGSASVALRICGPKEIVHPLESKFMPEYLPRIEDYNSVIVDTIYSEGDAKTFAAGGMFVAARDVCYDVTLNGSTHRYVVKEDSYGNLSMRYVLSDETGKLQEGPLHMQIAHQDGVLAISVEGVQDGDSLKIRGPIFYRKLNRMFAPPSNSPFVIAIDVASAASENGEYEVSVSELEAIEAVSEFRPITLIRFHNTGQVYHYGFESKVNATYYFMRTKLPLGGKVNFERAAVKFVGPNTVSVELSYHSAG